MYLTLEESADLAAKLAEINMRTGFDLVICPNTLAFTAVRDKIAQTSVSLGAQNVAWTPQGAYTGATSALMFREAGAAYALVGHSERRHIFNESNEDVRKKLEACLEAGLKPILCVGETREDRETGKTQYRLKKQLMKAFEGLRAAAGSIVIAYEPVWAISQAGVGEACLPADAADVHVFIAGEIKQYVDFEISIIYGGSVNPDNVADFVSRPSVAGVLVGSASTNIDSLSRILEIGASQPDHL